MQRIFWHVGLSPKGLVRASVAANWPRPPSVDLPAAARIERGRSPRRRRFWADPTPAPQIATGALQRMP